MMCLVWFVRRTKVGSILLDGSRGAAFSRRGRSLQNEHTQLQEEQKPNVTWEFLIYLAVLFYMIVLILEGLDLTFSLIT